MPAEENVVDNRAVRPADESMVVASFQTEVTAQTLQNEALRATITQLRHEITLFQSQAPQHR